MQLPETKGSAQDSGGKEVSARGGHRLTVLLSVVLLASLAFYLSALRTDRFGAYHDDGIYVATAKSLADGQGYRIVSLPGDPAETKYPPLYPALLSVVWRVHPAFPDNLRWMMLLSVAATMAFLILTRSYLVKNSYATQCQSLIVVAMTALNWRSMILATSVYSEMPFALLAVSTLYFAEKHEKARSVWLSGVIVGVLAGLAFLTRSSGIALVVSVGAYFVLRGKWKKALLPVAVAAVFIAGWVAWCYANRTSDQGINVAYYTSYVGHLSQVIHDMQVESGSSKATILVSIAVENIVGGVLISVPLVSAGLSYASLAFGGHILFGFFSLFVIFFLVAAGFIRTVSTRFRLLHVYIVSCLCLYLFWLPGVSYDRFLMPLLPFLLMFLTSELGVLASLARKGMLSGQTRGRMSGALISLVLIIVVSVTLYGYGSGMYSSMRSLRTSADRAAEDAEAFAWIEKHTDASETLICYRDPKYFLYTGHKAVRSFPMTEGFSWEEDETSMARLAQAIFEIIHEANARYVVVTSTDFELEDRPQQHRKTFDRFIEQHPQDLVLVFESAAGRSRIYRIESRAT